MTAAQQREHTPSEPGITRLSRVDWPPNPDAIVSTCVAGQVVSRFRDSVWDFSHWAGKRLVLNFGDGPQRKDRPSISQENAHFLRLLAAWILVGPRGARTPGSLKAKFKLVRPLFIACTEAGIVATDVFRYPAVLEQLGDRISPSRADEVISLLHLLYEQREELGFFMMDRAAIARVASSVRAHQPRQTPYVPSRIWSYAVTRSREFVHDYLAHQQQIESFFDHLLSTSSFDAEQQRHAANEGLPDRNTGDVTRFSDACESFGLTELLRRWATTEQAYDARALSSYLTLAGYAGMLYLIALSLMRIEEAWKLRVDCLKTHHDASLGEIYLIRGETTKTVADPDAAWVTSRLAVSAIDVLTSAARLRMKAAALNPRVPVEREYLDTPYLVPRSYDPWTATRSVDDPMGVRQAVMSLSAAVRAFPKFLDLEQLRIQDEDLRVARRVNPSLDPKRYGVGKIWQLSWHQFRRTGAVNMFASGLVSDASLQHQLKHSNLLMTHYYAQGFSEVALDAGTQSEVLGAMYEVAAQDSLELLGPDFVSAHGDDVKRQALSSISNKALTDLRKLSKKGVIPWRETPFGGCMNPDPCEFGGFDNMIRCGGGDGKSPCAYGLFNRARHPNMQQLLKRIELRLIETPAPGPLRIWLDQMSLSLKNMIRVMTREQPQ